MKVIIVEDELTASENLKYLLDEVDPTIEVVQVLESVKQSIDYLSNDIDAELIFMDIHLADGISFEIFDQVTINTPVIFTTAYDQYAIKAFKVNSVDYLLKPIDPEELSKAISKFKNQNLNADPISNQLTGMFQLLQNSSKSYKTTYLVHHKDELIPIKTDDIAYIFIDTGMVKAITLENKMYIIDKKMEDIEVELDPKAFFRANRQFIVQKKAVTNIKYYFNGKLIVNTNPVPKDRIVVSKAKATAFKSWMDE
ncbi:LytTR family DNA-binding domain-containing protein [Aquimarina sp. D1M17]|uniref:LytR/AlgR family response regulator transcription factor n=1 Tax=Aquimarina acroporae TaxID=2937283 RepID=UPI0020BFBFB5|nr:LytTR family DNA-binding domain-containing protein [Aquimarina acroporae]MCK8520760.1 LytTR family DNA-binding domain-containing protein [Aquimarina acroporae]